MLKSGIALIISLVLCVFIGCSWWFSRDVCPNCNSTVNTPYCEQCGEQVDAISTCPNCGAECDTPFCGNCGAKIE